MCLMVLEQIPEIRGSSMIYMEILCWYKPSTSAAANYQDTRKVVIGIYPHPTRLLPSSVTYMFPVIMQQRCAFTIRLCDNIITGIYQRQNFMELSEGIASMNFREFLRNNPDNNDLVKGFESSIFCSYPGNDTLIEFFVTVSTNQGAI